MLRQHTFNPSCRGIVSCHETRKSRVQDLLDTVKGQYFCFTIHIEYEHNLYLKRGTQVEFRGLVIGYFFFGQTMETINTPLNCHGEAGFGELKAHDIFNYCFVGV